MLIPPDNLPVDRQEPLSPLSYVADYRAAGKGAERANRRVFAGQIGQPLDRAWSSDCADGTGCREAGGAGGRCGRARAMADVLEAQADLNQPALDGPNGCLGTVRDRDLAKNVLHMLFDRFDADRQRAANFLIAEAQCQVAKHLQLASGQRNIIATAGTSRRIAPATLSNSPAFEGPSPPAAARIVFRMSCRQAPFRT